MYYKVKFLEKGIDGNEDLAFVKVFEASSAKKLDEQIDAYVGEMERVSDGEVQVAEKNKVTVEELVDEELKGLYLRIFKKYLYMKIKCGQLDSQKYSELKDKYLNNPKYFYEMLKYENKSLDVEEYLGRYNKHFEETMKDISAKQFFDRVRILSEGDSDTIGS